MTTKGVSGATRRALQATIYHLPGAPYGAPRPVARRYFGRRSRALALVAAATLASGWLGSCSSAPKRQTAVVERKNEAAEYAALADGFLASGQYSSALQYYGEALDASLSVDDVAGAVKSRGSLGRAYLAIGGLDDAAREFGDALEDARALGEPALVALCLSNLGELRYASGDWDAADALFAEAEALAAGDEAIAAVVAHNRGVVAMARADYAAAEAYVLRSAAANEKARRWSELGSNRYALASIANARGDLPGALAWAAKALEADKRAENSPGIGADLEALARLQLKSGNGAAAFDYYRRAFGLWLSLGRADDAERCLAALSGLASSLGKDGYAARYEALLARLRER
ncbi:MAG TPA: tetratricopeptide repeat protein [Spirochaetales bacterium]|nr:tetratricopeptide repeat protein [Spirochaetales bacterium]